MVLVTKQSTFLFNLVRIFNLDKVGVGGVCYVFTNLVSFA